ncbi:MAG: hypothetical protein AAFW01_02360 [Pseudomonadota bacterium]
MRSHGSVMFAILAFPLTKYLLVFAFFGLLDEFLRPDGRRALAARLFGGGTVLDALAVLFDRLVGRHPLSRRHLLSVVLLTLGAYLLLLSLYLAWGPLADALLGKEQEEVRSSALGQIAQFWVFFGLPATTLSVAVARVVIGALRRGRLPSRLRLPALLAGDVALTLVVIWMLYFGVMIVVRPLGDRQSVPETFELTNLTFAYAISFTSISGIYVFAAFVSTALVLATATAGTIARRLDLPERLTRQPMTLAAVPVFLTMLLADLALAVI